MTDITIKTIRTLLPRKTHPRNIWAKESEALFKKLKIFLKLPFCDHFLILRLLMKRLLFFVLPFDVTDGSGDTGDDLIDCESSDAYSKKSLNVSKPDSNPG